MPKVYIERYFDEQCLVPALRAMGQSRQVEAREGMLPHHEDYFEFHLVMDGTVNWWAEEEVYVLPPGSVFFTKPGELHGSANNLVQPSTLYWLQVDTAVLSDATIEQELARLTTRTRNGANELVTYVTAILAEIRRPKQDSPRMVQAYLSLFLARLLRQYHKRQVEPVVSKPFAELLAYIEAHLTDVPTLTVASLCRHVSLSRSRVFQLFNEQLGQSPISYVNTRRVEKARELLRGSSLPITEIGLDLGYSSSQHFASVFKRVTGLSPSEFRKSGLLMATAEDKEIGRFHQKGHWHE